MNLDRTQHVWFEHGNFWKCALCGGVTPKTRNETHPPSPRALARSYEPLTDAERARSPKA